MVMGKVLFHYLDELCSSSLSLPYSCICWVILRLAYCIPLAETRYRLN